MAINPKRRTRATVLGAALAAAVPAVASACTATAASTGPIVPGRYAFPLDGHWYREHRDWFQAPHHDYPAIDVPVPSGTTVYAAAAGRVIVAPVGGACGNGVIIDGNDGHRYTYCHGTNPLVAEGVSVSAGTPIMVSGDTGNASGPHLHLQIALGLGTGPKLCPQSALSAWAQGLSVDVSTLPQSGCTY